MIKHIPDYEPEKPFPYVYCNKKSKIDEGGRISTSKYIKKISIDLFAELKKERDISFISISKEKNKEHNIHIKKDSHGRINLTKNLVRALGLNKGDLTITIGFDEYMEIRKKEDLDKLIKTYSPSGKLNKPQSLLK